MATTKTSAKPAVKAPAAKTATKATVKAPAAKSTVKPVKLNQAVNVTRRNGEVTAGKVVKIEDKPNGRWITVNVSTDRKKPDLVVARASAVTAR